MDVQEKIKRLKSIDATKDTTYPETLMEVLNEIGDMPSGYDKMPKDDEGYVDVEAAIASIPTADYELACETLLAVSREAQLIGRQTYLDHIRDGKVQAIINRMIFLLQSNGSEAAEARNRMVSEGR